MGVYDAQRMGAIRFKESMDGVFLNDNQSDKRGYQTMKYLAEKYKISKNEQEMMSAAF